MIFFSQSALNAGSVFFFHVPAFGVKGLAKGPKGDVTILLSTDAQTFNEYTRYSNCFNIASQFRLALYHHVTDG